MMTKEEIDKFFNTALYALIFAEKHDEPRFKRSNEEAKEVLHDVWAIALDGMKAEQEILTKTFSPYYNRDS